MLTFWETLIPSETTQNWRTETQRGSIKYFNTQMHLGFRNFQNVLYIEREILAFRKHMPQCSPQEFFK